VGNGVDTFFGTYFWLGDFNLFKRLFDLSKNRWTTMVDMFHLGYGKGGETWKWRLRLLAWEEYLVGECREILHNVILQVNDEDKWFWQLNSGASYSVCGAYQFLTSHELHHFTLVPDSIWHKDVPLKVSLFSWCFLRNRLPTKDNLFR